MGLLHYIPYMSTLNDMNKATDKFKNKCRDDWEKTKSMPRKLKKKERKNILMLWRIANYNPFS